MRIFVTGAAGFIGSALVRELVAAGHQVVGLTRSEAGARTLTAAGAQPLLADLSDRARLSEAASAADAVAHLAFNHDFSRYLQNCEDDRAAIAALAEGLAGTGRRLVVTSGLIGLTQTAPGQPALEDAPPVSSAVLPRAASEEAAEAAAARGVAAIAMRLPQVHDPRAQGLITPAIAFAREKGVFAYVGEGTGRWAAAHVSDVARLYRLALEMGQGGERFHAVAEEGIPMRAIAEAVARRLGLTTRSIPREQAAEYFGWLARFAEHDAPASSAWTQQRLGWRPTGPTLLEDLARLEID